MGLLGFAVSVLFMAVLNVFAAFVLRSAVTSGQRVDAESHGKIVVSSSFLKVAKALKSAYDDSETAYPHILIPTLTIRGKPRTSLTSTGVKQKILSRNSARLYALMA